MFFETLERIKKLPVKHGPKTYTPESFTHLIRMQFRDPQLRFNCVRDSELSKKNFWITAEYCPYDDSQDDPCVYVTLTFGSRCRWVSFSDYDWDRMSFHLADTITHEYLHRYYCRRRGYKHGRGYRDKNNLRYNDTMKDYLGCEDEILAYAFNIASEMIVYDRHMVLTKVYRMYRRNFRQDRKVMLQLEKQVAKYIKRLGANHEQVVRRVSI
jgi:hypothetical protein